jgi:putative ABC transport system permease protein
MNQFTPAFRNLRKYPVFSLINLGGLSIGIAASFILLVYSQRELSCDRHFKDAGRIARIGTDFFHMGPFAISQPQLRDLEINSCKDIQFATALFAPGETPVRTSSQDRAFTGIYPYYIDADFFHVFAYHTIAGAIPVRGLAPGETILSAVDARKFFGSQDPIGQTLIVGKEMAPYKVVAVLDDSHEKSHLDPQVLLPRVPSPDAATASWTSAALYNYVKLTEQGSFNGLKVWFDRLRERVIYPNSGSTGSFAKWTATPAAVSFVVEPLADIYFHSDLKYGLSPSGNLMQVKLLSAISILLIVLAIINYVNLVTARSSIRAKELGLKKTFGASRRSLIGQLLRESVFFSLLAMVVACGLIQVLLFCYQYSTGAALTGPIPFLSINYLWLLLFSLAVGLCSGLYPAFYLTGIKTSIVVRSTTGSGRNNPRIRNGLVVLQFVIATSLLFISFVVYSQLRYMKDKDKGFRSEGVVLVENVDVLQERAATFQQLVEQQAAVAGSSFCQRAPASTGIVMYTYRTAAMQQNMSIQTFPVDDHYISTLGMHLTDGRNFDRHLLSDTNSLILNESAVAALGLFNPVGSLINGSEKVIGVVRDFNYASLHEHIGPVILRYTQQGSILAIRVRGGETASFLDWLHRTGQSLAAATPLKISFLDDNFARLAEKERLLGQAISFFTVLAIILATLGLIGLTLFTIEKRTKEIGIRKVLGADKLSILRLVSVDFVRLATIAAAIALPLSWWMARRWLDNFAYRVTISPLTFLATAFVILLIAFSVIGLLTMRTLAANPVKNLRTE